MPIPPESKSATVTFGFRATQPYLDTDDEAYRLEVKTEVDNNIYNETPQDEMIAALSVSLPVDEEGSAPDADVESLIDDVLISVSWPFGDPTCPNTFTRGVLEGIVYVWEGEIRYCRHSYFLNMNGGAWSVSDLSLGHQYSILVSVYW